MQITEKRHTFAKKKRRQQTMKVLILSTYEHSGGAAVAAGRLLHALQKNGIDAKMLCRKNISWWKGKPQSWTSIMERAFIWASNGFSMKNLWATDTGLFGQDITRTKEYQEADVIHLHWINQGFISLKAIRRFVKDKKKIVWTMHDEWNALGLYHFDIQQKDSCLDRLVRKNKQKLYDVCDIQFVTCSEWLRREVMASPIMERQNVASIPNPIDTSIFKPQPHTNKRRVLFVAQDINNPRKGMRYLDEAATILNGNAADKVEIIALGREIPYISDVKEMANLYASVDAFVLPSLSDNLPNTIMEAMACGTPCVGFDVGGIPEMIDHKVNGYVARYKDSQDLAEGIRYVLDGKNHARLSQACIEKVRRCYSEEAVAEKYIKVYDTQECCLVV